SAYSLTPPAGLAQLEQNHSGSQYLTIYAKTVESGDAGSELTFLVTALEGGNGAKATAVCLVYRGANLGLTASAGTASASTSHTTPLVTPNAYPAQDLACFSCKASDLTDITEPAGYILRGEQLHTGGGAVGVGIADHQITSGDAGGAIW